MSVPRSHALLPALQTNRRLAGWHVTFLPRQLTNQLIVQELKRLVAVVIDYVTSINEAGCDLYFLNRGVVRGVKSVAGLSDIFSNPPGGGELPIQVLADSFCAE